MIKEGYADVWSVVDVGNMTYTLNTIPETKSHKSFWYSNLPSDIGNVWSLFKIF
jgi:hypothetical protein